MKNSRAKRTLNSALYILITAVVVIGMPIVLLRIAGWPLPTKVPNFTNVSTAIQQQNIPSEVIIKALAVILWLVWMQLVWSLIWEIIYVGPKLAKGLQARSAPMSSSPMQHLAARLVGGIMSVGLITTSFASNSALPTDFVPTLSVAPDDVESEAIDEPAQVEIAVAAKVWRVMPGDSLWSISNGNEAVMNAIFEANPNVNTALDVEPGIDLVVPDELDVPQDRLVEHVAETNVTIEKGDHLWGIAEERLEQALPTDPSNAEIADYVSEIVEQNPSVASNPNLIHPNDQYIFPETGAPAFPETIPVAESGRAEEANPERSASSTDSGATEQRQLAENDQGIVGSVGSLITSPRGIILGAGLFGLFLSLQQRQLVQGATIPLRRRRGEGHPDDLMKASKLPLVEWAGKELSKLVEELRAQAAGDAASYPRLLEVRLGDGIEVIWQTPQLKEVKPWEVSEGGRRWKLPYRANAKVVRGPVPAAFGALVTLGSWTMAGEPIEQRRLRKQTEAEPYSQSVLVNLTDYGTMSLVGPPEHIMSTARSLVLELGTSENMANAKVLVVGMEIDGTEHMHRVKEGTAQEALALLRSAAVTKDSPNQTASVIFIPSDSPSVQTLLAASPAGSGTAVVVVGAAENTQRHFVVQPNGTDAFFLDNQADVIEPAAVTASQAAEIGRAFDAAVEINEVDWDIDLDDGTAQAKAASIVLQLGSTPNAGGVGAVPVTLNVLGEPSISGIDPNHAALAAISLVLSTPARSMKDNEVIDTVWGSGTITTEEFWEEIEKLRSKLSGDAISRSSSNELIVSPSVRTDLEIFASYVSQSVGLGSHDELILLLEALKLVGGVPFTGSPLCHWAYRSATPLALQAIDLIEATALRAATLGIESQDYVLADRAISQGLSGTGPNEPLMRMQMRIEAAKGNIEGVEAVFHDFSNTLSNSPWKKPVAPSTETTSLHNQLVSPSR